MGVPSLVATEILEVQRVFHSCETESFSTVALLLSFMRRGERNSRLDRLDASCVTNGGVEGLSLTPFTNDISECI